MVGSALVIGAGAAGIFTALDLAGRGVSVLVVDSRGLARGTSGRYHGLIHSGARYAVTDPSAATQCAQENLILGRIAPHAIIHSGGYFVALKDDDQAYVDGFMGALEKAGIGHSEVDSADLRAVEPNLSRDVEVAIRVQDKVADPFRLLGGAALLAKKKGVRFMFDAEVGALDPDSGSVTAGGREFKCDAVVNAAGAWAGKVAALAGRGVPVMPSVGVMLVYRRRLVRSILNRLRRPSDGDLILPFYDVSILGTTALVVEDPDHVVVEEEDIEPLVEEGSRLLPALSRFPYDRHYYSVRPLVKRDGEDARGGSREFEILRTGERMVTVIGGKLTTGRLMGQMVGEVVGEALGAREGPGTEAEPLPDPFEPSGFADTIGDERYAGGMDLARLERMLQD